MFTSKGSATRMMALMLAVPLALLLAVHACLSQASLTATEPAKDAGTDTAALLKTRASLAKKAYEATWASFRDSKKVDNRVMLFGSPAEVHTWSVRWLQAERDLNSKSSDQSGALRDHVKRMKELEQQVKKMVVDLLPIKTTWEVEWYRLEAELWLTRGK